MSEPTTIDLEDLGLDRGAGVLLDRALASLAPGERLTVRGRHPELAIQLRAWCRGRGDRLERDGVTVVRGDADRSRWHDATRASGGPPDLAARADARWGLAARGALVESGGPTPRFDLDGRDLVWADAVPRLYAQALASQWDPATAIDWAAADPLAPELEAAVVQVMTFLVE
ncbi:MAG TPA: ferritin-like domain-containing protein, partial [Acidimicrobiia bacterium]